MSAPSPHPWRRTIRLTLVVLALLAYLAADVAMLAAQPAKPLWDLTVTGRGIVTWVDPNGPADTAGVAVGDAVMRSRALSRLPFSAIVTRPVLHIRHAEHVRVLRPVAAFGATPGGQALVLVGALLLLIGALAWSSGRRGRAGDFLGALSAAAALTLLGATWGPQGYTWALRLAYAGGVLLFPLAWAAFFLSFPEDRLRRPRWRAAFTLLCAAAVVALVLYALCFVMALPYAAARACAAPVLLGGLLLGLLGLVLAGRGATRQARQQRRLMTLSASGAVAPLLLLSLLPQILLGQPLVPYTITALALIVLPLGLAYAIVRYDLMEIDVVVRRVVAQLVAALALVALTVVAAAVLHPLLPRLDRGALIIAVLAGALGGRYLNRWTPALTERLLAPELRQSRRLLLQLDPLLLTGDHDLPALAACVEAAAQAVIGGGWATLLVRRRMPGAIFRAVGHDAVHVSLPLLTADLATQPWGLARQMVRLSQAVEEWEALDAVLDDTPGVIVPLRLRGDVIAVLVVGERSAAEPLTGPNREALAHVAAHFALAIDHARTRADLDAEGADAAVLSAAHAGIAAALDDRVALPRHIVDKLTALRDMRGVALLLYGHDGTPSIAATAGDAVSLMPPLFPSEVAFDLAPYPRAWLPLAVGGRALGALCLRWSDGYVVRDHEQRLLAVYANGAAMALEHARLYERARIQAERDPVTDLYNHRAFHARLETALGTGGQVGLLLIDLTDFKLFNDTHGHQAGDQALRRVGEVLRACCRDTDAAARLGGDEFALVAPGADPEATRSLAERVAGMVGDLALASPDGQLLPVRLTIGVAAFPHDAATANALLAVADERLYEAKRAGVAISTVRDARRAEDEVYGGRFSLLEALVAMVDNRDRYTAEHSEQVATYACAIAAELGLSHDTIETLRLAGLLHDVGKIGVPDRILRKPSRLSDEEFDIVRRHVELSEALVSVVAQDRDLLDAVRHHHERWDGRGYPRRLEGETIPLLGRIMIVADAVSAMAMDRPYRKGLSWDQIAQELIRGSAVQFDPALVEPALHALQHYIKRTHAA